MDKEQITLNQFKAFKRLRGRGIINMNDIVTGARLCMITEEAYETIMWNYGYLEEKFKNKM
jgi:hypothetical protein